MSVMPTHRRPRLNVPFVLAGAFIYAMFLSSALADPVSFWMSPRGHILVPVSVDGGAPRTFVLDTGAGSSTVTPDLARELGLEAIPGESARALGKHGLTENPIVRVKSLSLGDSKAVDRRLVVLGLDHITLGEWQADGILGMDFLRAFDLRIDFASRSVDLFPGASSVERCRACPAGVEGTAFETVRPAFVILPITVDGHPVRAVLDTGSGHSGLNGKAVASLGVTLPPLPQGSPQGHGFGLETGPVRLGDQVLTERATLRVMDHPVMSALGLSDGPSMLIGTDQFSGRTLTICYQLETVFLQ
jgi:predicted aspartyl protease